MKWTSGHLLHVAKTDEWIYLLQNVIKNVLLASPPVSACVREGLMHLHPHPGLNTPATSCRRIYFYHDVNTPAPTICPAPRWWTGSGVNVAWIITTRTFSVPVNTLYSVWFLISTRFVDVIPIFLNEGCLQLRII